MSPWNSRLIIDHVIWQCYCSGRTEKEEKKFKLEMPKMNLREKIGDMAGNLMTAKTADLSLVAPMVTLVTGMYSKETGTSESNYFPDNMQEGDHLMAITFMKNAGMGMYKILGDVTVEGQETEYPGLGSYMYTFDKPIDCTKNFEHQNRNWWRSKF